MNLAQVLHEALPDAPPPKLDGVYPRVHPNLIVREHTDREGTMLRVIAPGGELLFRLNKLQFELLMLFDGQRSYEQVAQLFHEKTGLAVTAEQVKSFADSMDKGGFWYRTPQEQSILLCNKLMNDRHHHAHGASSSDLARLDLLFFDPDEYLAWIYSKVRFLYTPWFFVTSVVMLLIAIGLVSSRWSEIWSDSVAFYNLTEKGWYELGIFLLAFVLLGAVHETAHGMTVKHFGAHVHKMGFYLVYGVPALFCDVTEVYVYGSRWARIMTTFAGVWSEMIIVSIAAYLWWFTPRGSYVHDFCYMVILAGGVLVVMINWNPFSKLDGYFLFNEIFHFFDIKSQSTTFLIQWIRRHVFGLPAKVPTLKRLHQVGFAAYALLSGFYCYGMLLFFVRIAYKIGYKYSPTWAFLPATVLALMIFRSRIEKLLVFCKEVYVDRKALLRAHWRPIVAGLAVLGILICLPIMRDSTELQFVLQAKNRATVRAEVDGEVAEVLTNEGGRVFAGQPLIQLRNIQVEQSVAAAEMLYKTAQVGLSRAQLQPSLLGSAVPRFQQANTVRRTVLEREALLTSRAPISGIVLSPTLQDLRGSYVAAGTPLVEIADPSVLEARIFVPEADMRIAQGLTSAKLRAEGSLTGVSGKVISISPASQDPDASLYVASKYKGVELPNFYLLTVELDNRTETMHPGETGSAKLYGHRTPLIALMARPMVEAVARRLW